MKKLLPIVVLIGILVFGAGVWIGTHYLADHYLTAKSVTTDCKSEGKQHRVAIKNDIVTPQHTEASLCDSLTITNQDAHIRLIAFGQHDKHVAYDGVTETVLGKGQSLTLELNQAGTYRFHDHDNEATAGDFTVSE
ncbi:MAG: hypothetical protein AAB436_02930 [Patescibacteria group bacterium]